MNKGQVFSIDFLFAMIIAVLALGTIIGLSEAKMFEAKENVNSQINQEKAETALMIIANDVNTQCKVDTNLLLPYSINKQLLINLLDTGNKIQEYKKRIGLSDYNVELTITVNSTEINPLIDDELLGQNVIVLETNILLCQDHLIYSDMNACLTGNAGQCSLKATKEIVRIKVSK